MVERVPVSSSNRFYVYGLYRNEDLTDVFYIGKGCGLRLLEHEKNLEKEKQSNHRKYYTIKSILKLLPTVPKKIISAELTEDDAFGLEKELILKYGRLDLGTGCLTNLCEGGLGASRSFETRLKIKAARAKQVITTEHKAKIGAKSRGRKHSPEAKAKISSAQKGRIRSEEAKQRHSKIMRGRKHTEKTCQKMSLTRKGRKLSTAHSEAISAGLLGRKLSQTARLKISLARKGVSHTIAHKQAISASLLKYYAEARASND